LFVFALISQCHFVSVCRCICLSLSLSLSVSLIWIVHYDMYTFSTYVNNTRLHLFDLFCSLVAIICSARKQISLRQERKERISKRTNTTWSQLINRYTSAMITVSLEKQTISVLINEFWFDLFRLKNIQENRYVLINREIHWSLNVVEEEFICV
jgi:hypothetical protein